MATKPAQELSLAQDAKDGDDQKRKKKKSAPVPVPEQRKGKHKHVVKEAQSDSDDSSSSSDSDDDEDMGIEIRRKGSSKKDKRREDAILKAIIKLQKDVHKVKSRQRGRGSDWQEPPAAAGAWPQPVYAAPRGERGPERDRDIEAIKKHMLIKM